MRRCIFSSGTSCAMVEQMLNRSDMTPEPHHYSLLHDNLASMLAMLSGSLIWVSDDRHVQILVGIASIFCAVTMGVRNIIAIRRGRP